MEADNNLSARTDVVARVLRGGGTVLLAQGGKFLLQVGTTVLLARLLAPEAFGLVALALAFTGLFGLFQGLGLLPAIVQAAHLTQGQLSTLFWLNLGFGLGLLLLLAGLSPLLSLLSGDPRLVAIVSATALVLPLGSAAATHRALLTRQLRLGALVGVDLSSLGLALLLAVCLALAGAGVWALIAMPLAQAGVQLAATWWLCPWRPGWPVRGSGVRPLLSFGGDLLAVAVIAHLARQCDKVAIGLLFGPTALGYYSRAWQLYLLPTSQLLSPLYDVVVPTLSRLVADSGRYLLLFAGTLVALTLIASLLALLLWWRAEAVVGLLLGSEWGPVAPVLHLLAPAVIAQPLLSASGWALTSLGATRRFRRLAWVTTLWQIAFILLALPFGLPMIALAVTLGIWVVTVPLTLTTLYACRPALGWAAAVALVPALPALAIMLIG